MTYLAHNRAILRDVRDGVTLQTHFYSRLLLFDTYT
jgi:hypothetical protein